MRFWQLLSRLLSLAVIAGLLIAPVMTSPLAGTMTAASMMAMPDMGFLPDAPTGGQSDQKRAPDCQEACPVAVGCVAKGFPGTDAAAGVPVRIASGKIAPSSDSQRESLAGPPPHGPPRA